MSIRIIHLGVGVRGRHWLEIIANHPDFSTVACVDKDPKALEEVRGLPGQQSAGFSDFEEALSKVPADAVLIASPSSLHARHASLALNAGLAVLVEKPLGTTLEAAAEVVELAQKLGRPLMVAENFRFFQAERTLRRLLRENLVGAIGAVTCIDRRDQPSRSQGSWVRDMEEPFLNEIAVHHFDSFRYFFNSPAESVFARSFNPPGSDYKEGGGLEALIRLENGLSIQYSGTFFACRYEYQLIVEGEKGDLKTDRKSIFWRPRGEKAFQNIPLDPVPQGDELPYPKAGTVSILNQFRDSVQKGVEPETSGLDNLQTIAMVEAARLSIREGREAGIGEVFAPALRARLGVVEQKKTDAAPVASSAAGRKRVLFIGLDSADAELIDQWEHEGLLPNFSRLKARGMAGRLGTTAEILHVSAWASIFTGVTADKHGLYHAYVMNPGEQGPTRPRPDKTPFPFFWKLLSDSGKRSVVMDAFMTCPLQNFNGSQVVEWGTWSWFCEPTVLPAALKTEMESRFGAYPAPDHSKVTVFPDSADFRDKLLKGVRAKTDVVKWLMGRDDWDLFLTVFGETHPAGHYLWHLHDPSYPNHPKDAEPKLRQALRDVYIAIDAAIGEILDQADARTTVFVVSGDGMGPNYSGSHVLEELLKRMGLLQMAAGNGANTGSGKARLSKDNILSFVRSLIPQRLRMAISQAFFSHAMKDKLALKWLTAGIAWENTRAFLISNANEGYVRVNLKGREPQGTVNPGAEYQALIDELYDVFRSMKNPENGIPAAASVHKTDDLFNGPCRDQMPDLIVNWNPDARITDQLLTAKFGSVKTRQPGYGIVPFYVGNHRPNAFAYIVGPGIPEGERIEGGHILDLTPTVLAVLGMPAPSHMDGKSLGLSPRAESKAVAI